ncbi:protein gvpH 1 [Haloglomus irregulare]|jgi:HSP20 family molecular chaperone IbpA|uniref:Protein gvpH 1 n=1 Tax=Haloglomus irregulare TaxID=2234134 RepID=A0A554NBL1_9EURY|nr:gas vesicle protein GvpH [Haloglomus irregulare]TSD14759.1 protein gvpH 1 [Haloglomus irregulare]
MPPDKSNDDTSDGKRDNTSAEPTGLLDQLRTLLKMLAEIEEEEAGHRRGSGQINHGTSRVNYNYDVSIGLGQYNQSSTTRSSSHQSHSERRSRHQRATEDSVSIETREGTSDDELVVIADLPGVADEDDVDVDLDADEPALILWIDENEMKRIPLDQSEMTITDMIINNQVLEIRVSRESDSNRGTTNE